MSAFSVCVSSDTSSVVYGFSNDATDPEEAINYLGILYPDCELEIQGGYCPDDAKLPASELIQTIITLPQVISTSLLSRFNSLVLRENILFDDEIGDMECELTGGEFEAMRSMKKALLANENITYDPGASISLLEKKMVKKSATPGPLAKQVSGVQFELQVDSFRGQQITGTKGSDGKPLRKCTCYIRADILVNKMQDLQNWMDVNPRVPKRLKSKMLAGGVPRGIEETINNRPSEFAIVNLGLYILVEDAIHNRETGQLTISLLDPEIHGLCNGGHTFSCLLDYHNRHFDMRENLKQVYVPVHFFIGVQVDDVPLMAEGLNRSKQVKDADLANLQQHFSSIKKSLEGHRISKFIAYHDGATMTDDEGDEVPCPIPITDVIRAIMLFDCSRFSPDRHPNTLYRNQKKMIEMFTQSDNEGNSVVTPGMQLVIPHASEILELGDKIAQNLMTGQYSGFQYGMHKAKGNKRLADGGTTLYAIDESVEKTLVYHWTLPMLAAFRANVRFDMKSTAFEWKKDNDVLLDQVMPKLVEILVNQKGNVGADRIGSDKATYDAMHSAVELVLLRESVK